MPRAYPPSRTPAFMRACARAWMLASCALLAAGCGGLPQFTATPPGEGGSGVAASASTDLVSNADDSGLVSNPVPLGGVDQDGDGAIDIRKLLPKARPHGALDPPGADRKYRDDPEVIEQLTAAKAAAASAGSGEVRVPENTPTTTDTDVILDAFCAGSAERPEFVDSTNTALSIFRNRFHYMDRSIVPIGEADPLDPEVTVTEFAKKWCTIDTGDTFGAVFDLLGEPNLQIGAYSVWEVGRSRFFLQFTAKGTVTAWATASYPKGWETPVADDDDDAKPVADPAPDPEPEPTPDPAPTPDPVPPTTDPVPPIVITPPPPPSGGIN